MFSTAILPVDRHTLAEIPAFKMRSQAYWPVLIWMVLLVSWMTPSVGAPLLRNLPSLFREHNEDQQTFKFYSSEGIQEVDGSQVPLNALSTGNIQMPSSTSPPPSDLSSTKSLSWTSLLGKGNWLPSSSVTPGGIKDPQPLPQHDRGDEELEDPSLYQYG